jgi:predicted methyltransferase
LPSGNSTPRSPVITLPVVETLRAAMARGETAATVSLDLGRSQTALPLTAEGFLWQGATLPLPARVKERTVYYYDGTEFVPVARFGPPLVKLVATEWDAPTFEIDGIKMLPTAKVSPWEDAIRKVALVAPGGREVLDTCGGLGYFAAACLAAGARRIVSFEKNPDVLWLRTHNPWSPVAGGALELRQGDVAEAIAGLPTAGFGALLHDPPRFGIAGELYSQAFYGELARVLERRGRLFHYTGTPNKLTSGRDVPNEVAKRLKVAGFTTEMNGDGVLAVRR